MTQQDGERALGRARAELTADIPVDILPGNHDGRSAFRKVLLGQESTGPINRARTIGGVRFAWCDSSIPGRDEGLLASARAASASSICRWHAFASPCSA